MFVECLDPTKLVGVNAPPACSLHALLASPAKLQQVCRGRGVFCGRRRARCARVPAA